jgi:hypothetical protein
MRDLEGKKGEWRKEKCKEEKIYKERKKYVRCRN